MFFVGGENGGVILFSANPILTTRGRFMRT